MVDQQVVDAPYGDAQSATVPALVLRLRPAIDLSREQFFQFCQLNRDVTIERTAEGDIAIMAPAGWETSMRNARLIAALYLWAEEDGSGVVCDSSAGFELPNGAVRSPDVGWVARSRLARIPREQKRRFLPLCPDFVIELCSPSDSVPALQRKMEEYRASGTRLGWLILPDQHLVFIYRPNGVERRVRPSALTGDEVLPGLVLPLAGVWESSPVE